MLFKKTRFLEQKVDEYLDLLSKSALTFKEGVYNYLDSQKEEFERHLESIVDIENTADNLRRDIETHLYTHTLIPESRGDVLALLETTDDVNDHAKATLVDFSIEQPDVPERFKEDFRSLTDYAIQTMDAMVVSTRAFFRNLPAVRDNLHKVHFYEKEADKVLDRLKISMFRNDSITRLSHKLHLREFAYNIGLIADYSEDVADRLAIYTIKRSI